MREVVFLDTSVLLNILDVPEKNADRDAVVRRFTSWQNSGAVFALPVTTLIETGNHIAQLGDGRARRRCAKALVEAIQLAIGEEPAWVVTGEVWDRDLVTSVLDGAAHRPPALDLLAQGLGVGDIGILAERDAYLRRIPSATPVHVWTLDDGLRAYTVS